MGRVGQQADNGLWCFRESLIKDCLSRSDLGSSKVRSIGTSHSEPTIAESEAYKEILMKSI